MNTSALAGQRKDIVDTAVDADNLKTLVAAVKAAGLVEALKSEGPFTVFAPTDDAFEKLPEGTLQSLLKPENKGRLTEILTYHVVAGRVPAKKARKTNQADTLNGAALDISYLRSSNPERVADKLFINDASVSVADISASNGVIHVIDAVLIPAEKCSSTPSEKCAQSTNACEANLSDIVGTAKAAGSFKTLLAAASAAGLAETLQGEGPFTVFAPTDAAFAKLPKGTVETLLKSENRDQLTAILTYHVVPGRVFAKDVVKTDSAKTVQGSPVHVRTRDNEVYIDDARVVQTDVRASNGVIHVIDSVLNPESVSNHKAMAMIRGAIQVGVPMFNHGNHDGCADLYEKACQDIVDAAGEDISHHAVERLQSAMKLASHSNHGFARAWILRHGMDIAYRMMQQQIDG
jgi:uncharacterized surface protein with fasciclin (FAS1) repeats